MDTLHVLATTGVVTVAAVAASAAFQRIRVPDVLLLIVAGFVTGPLLHWSDPAVFAAVAPFGSIAAVLVILYDGGLEIQLEHLRRGAGQAAALALLCFVATAALCAAIAMWLLAMPPLVAVLLGMCFGGAGVAVVLPVIRRMDVHPATMAFVSVETATADVLLVVGVFSLAAAMAVHETGVAFALRLGLSFAVAIAVGLAAGWLWARTLRTPFLSGHESLATTGALLAVYAACEALGGSGPLCVLVFGLALGNLPTSPLRTHYVRGAGPEWARPGGENVRATFHREAMLAVRAFVFFGLGVQLKLSSFQDGRLLVVAVLLTVAIVVGRLWALGLVGRRVLPATWDRVSVALMFPCGLPTAAASIVPWARFGIPGTQAFTQVAAVTILMSIIAMSGLVAFVMQPRVRRRLQRPPGVAG